VAARADEVMSQVRVPPHSLEAEQAVLGVMLLDNDHWDDVSSIIQAQDFYSRSHQLVYEAIHDLQVNQRAADVVTVREQLLGSGNLESIGGEGYLYELAGYTTFTGHLDTYASIIRDYAQLRRLISAGNEIVQRAVARDGTDASELIDWAEQKVFEVKQEHGRNTSGFAPMREHLGQAIDRIEMLYDSDDPITGISTGFDDMDDMTSGLQPSDLIIVAGRPAMGKTSFVMNLVETAAIKSNSPVGVYSLEMPGQQLAMRMMASLRRIDAHRVRTGNLTDSDFARLTSALELLQAAQIHIDDSSGLSPIEVRSRARRLAREIERQNEELTEKERSEGKPITEKKGLGMIVIDYLQLMSSNESIENRTAEISAITRSLKTLARELNIPVIALSQLSRKPEDRPNKRPIMSDLRESGAIEQDADVIMFIYRDEVYNEESPDKGTAEIIIGKQRNGPIGTVRLAFLKEYTRFENYSGAPEFDNEF